MASDAGIPREPPMLSADAVRSRGLVGAGVRRWRPPPLGEAAFIVWPLIALYATVASMLVFGEHAVVSDAWSRVSSAHAALHSRDPHLAAIGFVWSPLPTFLLLPLVALADFWRPIVADGFAASIVSVLAMAGAVLQLRGMLSDWGMPAGWRILLTMGFALHPMTVLFAANGNSEALFLFTLLLGARFLSRWVATQQLAALVTSGLALALAYLTRYEAVAAAALAGAVVVGVAYGHARGSARFRRSVAIADLVVFAFPVTAAAILWAGASWLITGSPFEQFTSAYGVSAQVGVGFERGELGDPSFLARQLIGLQPAIGGLAVGVVVLAAIRRDTRWLAPAAILGGVLLFVAGAWITGRTGGWIRYAFTVIPIGFVLTGLVVAWSSALTARASTALGRWVPRFAAASLVVVVAGSSYIATVATWRDPEVGRTDLYVPGAWQKADLVARWLDARDLPRGSVLMDSFLGYSVFARSNNPAQFVVTSDRDFQGNLADLPGSRVRYVLVPGPTTALAGLDAVNRTHPGLYDGGDLASVVIEFDTNDHSTVWRVLEIENNQ